MIGKYKAEPRRRPPPPAERPRTAGSGRLMLADKDRIFTNLYGFQDRGLEAREEARPVGQHQGDPGAGPGGHLST